MCNIHHAKFTVVQQALCSTRTCTTFCIDGFAITRLVVCLRNVQLSGGLSTNTDISQCLRTLANT